MLSKYRSKPPILLHDFVIFNFGMYIDEGKVIVFEIYR